MGVEMEPLVTGPTLSIVQRTVKRRKPEEPEGVKFVLVVMLDGDEILDAAEFASEKAATMVGRIFARMAQGDTLIELLAKLVPADPTAKAVAATPIEAITASRARDKVSGGSLDALSAEG